MFNIIFYLGKNIIKQIKINKEEFLKDLNKVKKENDLDQYYLIRKYKNFFKKNSSQALAFGSKVRDFYNLARITTWRASSGQKEGEERIVSSNKEIIPLKKEYLNIEFINDSKHFFMNLAKYEKQSYLKLIEKYDSVFIKNVEFDKIIKELKS